MTRRGQFLTAAEHAVPWAELESRVHALHERAGLAVPRPAVLRHLLRGYLLAHWFNLSDAALEEELQDSCAMRRFAQVETLASLPDEAAIAKFRRLLRHHGGEEILSNVRCALARAGIRVRDLQPECPRQLEAEPVPAAAPAPWLGRPLATVPAPAAPETRPAHAAAVELALETLGVGVFEWEPASGIFRFSARCRQILGLGADEEPTTERLLSLVHPEDRHLTAALRASTLPGGPPGFSVQLRVIHPDGARRWVRVSGRGTFDETGRTLRSYGTMLDVTGQRLAERRLYELDSQLSTFIEGAPASIATFDRDMRFIEVSRHYAADRGVSPADLVGRCLYDVFPRIPERWKAVHARCLAGASERCELDVLVRPDGEEEHVWWEMRPWYREDQTVGGLVLVSEVITQRVRAQQRLRESEARLAAAVRAGALGIYDYDLIDGTTNWDARVRELWGISATEKITYETFLSGVHPEDRTAALAALDASLGPDGNGTHASEYRVVHRLDGSIRWIASTGTLFFDDNKRRAVRLVGIVQDITSRKLAELELRRADQRKDLFLATLSHELRNPLTPIRNAAYILASPDLTPGQLAWARQVIQRQTAHMASLLNDLLDIARITRGKLALKKDRVSLMAIVDAALETATPLLNKKRHHLTVSLDGLAELQLMVDPLRISQILSNLLANAAKYTEPGGEIELSARLGPGTLTLTVKDNGIGMQPEALARIFEMFWQVRDDAGQSQGGLGIGLALVKSLVELHGGWVEAESEGTGRGSELIVHLPVDLSVQTPAVEPQPQPEPQAAATGSCRVLLADDNRDAANTLAVLLSRARHEVRVAHGGAAALKLAESFRPDVALLDIAMPGLDGYGVARALRRAPWAAGMRLIAITGRGQEEDKQRARAAGFDHHLTKPIDPEALEHLLCAEAAAPVTLLDQ